MSFKLDHDCVMMSPQKAGKTGSSIALICSLHIGCSDAKLTLHLTAFKMASSSGTCCRALPWALDASSRHGCDRRRWHCLVKLVGHNVSCHKVDWSNASCQNCMGGDAAHVPPGASPASNVLFETCQPQACQVSDLLEWTPYGSFCQCTSTLATDISIFPYTGF